jgi:hypothetical protein
VEAKLRDKYSTYALTAANKNSHQWNCGIMIDLFIYDLAYLPHNVFIYALNRTLTALYWAKGPNNIGNQKKSRPAQADFKVFTCAAGLHQQLYQR